MKQVFAILCTLFAAGAVAAQEMTPPKYNGADMQYYMGRLTGEVMKIAEEEFVPAMLLSPEVFMRCTIDTLGIVTGIKFLDRSSDGFDQRDVEPATPRTQELFAKAIERLGSLTPAEYDGEKDSYTATMQLRIPVEKLASKQEEDPLLFLGEDPEKSFHPWAKVRIRWVGDEFAKKEEDGRVHVRFYIEPDGRITIDKILEADNEKRGKEVVRVIKSSKGKWTPRKVQGVPQRTAYVYRVYQFYH